MSELVTVQHLANKVNPEIKFPIYKESPLSLNFLLDNFIMTTPSDRIIEFHTVTPGPRFSIPSSISTAAKDSSSSMVQRVEEHGVFSHWVAMEMHQHWVDENNDCINHVVNCCLP